METFQGLQHIEALVGVQWDESQYFPPVYPPFWYAAVSPLSHLNYALAVHLWALLMTVCLIVSLLLLYKFTETPLPLLLAFCVFTPVIHSISSGQKGTLLLLIFTTSFVLLKVAQPAKSGVVFALSLFKPYLGVSIGLLMLVSGRVRWVAATLLSVGGIAFGTYWAYPQLSRDYLEVCLGFGDYVKSSGYDLHKSYSLWSGWQLLIPHSTTAKVLTVDFVTGGYRRCVGLSQAIDAGAKRNWKRRWSLGVRVCGDDFSHGRDGSAFLLLRSDGSDFARGNFRRPCEGSAVSGLAMAASGVDRGCDAGERCDYGCRGS